jgi:hypothetical protein
VCIFEVSGLEKTWKLSEQGAGRETSSLERGRNMSRAIISRSCSRKLTPQLFLPPPLSSPSTPSRHPPFYPCSRDFSHGAAKRGRRCCRGCRHCWWGRRAVTAGAAGTAPDARDSFHKLWQRGGQSFHLLVHHTWHFAAIFQLLFQPWSALQLHSLTENMHHESRARPRKRARQPRGVAFGRGEEGDPL